MKNLLTEPFVWEKFSKTATQKILKPFNQGQFTPDTYENRPIRHVEGQAGQISQGGFLKWTWLVDTDDGILIDAKYQFYGPTVLVAACEASCEIIVGKGYDVAMQLRTDQIELKLRDKPHLQALPAEADPYLNLVVDALEDAGNHASDIPIAQPVIQSPLPKELQDSKPQFPNWIDLSLKERLQIVRDTIDTEIRPYVELDSGGVDVLRIDNDYKVVIVYSGACDGCFAATGSTLSSIQAILRARIHPEIYVEPEL